MFRGNHPTRVDEKGRLKVPAEFKRVIDEKYGQKFYITSLDGKVAQVYPFEEWERIEQKLAALSTFNPTKKKFLEPGELLRSEGRDGRTGPVVDSAVAARIGADQGRSGSVGKLDVPGSAQPGNVPSGNRRGVVHA